jgi:hypothetical protein
MHEGAWLYRSPFAGILHSSTQLLISTPSGRDLLVKIKAIGLNPIE